MCRRPIRAASRPWGDVAQLVEQAAHNRCVGGSIPFIATILYHVRWPMTSGAFPFHYIKPKLLDQTPLYRRLVVCVW
jgi:hypothetical protein